MRLLFEILTHTPVYVWIFLALIVWRGTRALKSHWVTLYRLLALPILIIVAGTLGASFRSPQDTIGWAVMASLFAPLGYIIVPHPLSINRARRRLLMPASVLVMVRLLAIFLIRYALAVLTALHPDRRSDLNFATSLFSGAFAGYYVGWTVYLLRAYYRAPLVPVAEVEAAA
jgi:hypothetical protein